METIDQDLYADQKQILPKAVFLQNLFLRNVRNSVVDMLERFGINNVLDVCSGAGALAAMIKRRGMDVEAVDGSRTMADFARSHYGVITKTIPAERMEFKEQFDAAVIGMSLHDMSEEQRNIVWQRIERAVKTGGMIIVVDFNAPNPNMLGRMVANMIELDDSSFEVVGPGHYDDYKKFMAEGGIIPWIQKRKGYLHAVKKHMSGNIAVVAVAK